MTLSRNIWTPQDVEEIIETVKMIIKKELITMEYTVQGNTFRKEFGVDLNTLLTACDEYLSLYGNASQRTPDQTNTRTFIIS
jgi:hypothetical protein